jgi:hypothetical protein
VNEVEVLLVGLVVNQVEVGTLQLVRPEDTLLVPLEEFSRLLQLPLQVNVDNQVILNTPLGEAVFSPGDIIIRNGIRYLPAQLLAEQLVSEIAFDPAVFALVVQIPWRLGAGIEAQQSLQLVPDVRPQDRFLTTLSQDLFYTDSGSGADLQSSTTLNGRLFQGDWRLRWDQDFEQRTDLEEAFIRWHLGRSALLVGQQKIQLHPLLADIELTGIQWGTSNLSQEQLQISGEAGPLFLRQINPRRTFSGLGPPAGLAQLRLNGVLESEQRLDLEGRYQFVDIPLERNRLSEVEILLFAPDNFSTPVEIRRETVQLSSFLIPEGGRTHVLGFGQASDQAVAFLQDRRGVRPSLTLETVLQQTPDAFQLQAGAIWQPLPAWTVATDVAYSDQNLLAYNLATETRLGHWKIEANLEHVPATFRSTAQTEQWDQHLELQFQPLASLELGLVARQRLQDEENFAFIQPLITWRGGSLFSLFGRPNAEGIFLLDGRLVLGPRTQLAVSLGETSLADLSWRPTSQFQVLLSQELSADATTGASRTTLQLTKSGIRRGSPSVSLGLNREAQNLGFQVSGTMELTPGILTALRYESNPQTLTGNSFSLTLNSTFSVGEKGLLPGRQVGAGQGALAGRIQVGGRSTTAFNLENVQLLVDGQPRGRSDSTGGYFIPNLEPGLYRLELDPAQLPFALVPERTQVIAEVEAGAVTTFDFAVQALYGVAGQVRDAAGDGLTGVRVLLTTTAGNIIAEGQTDRFGYYRLNQVPSGNYQITVDPSTFDSDIQLPFRAVEIVDEFLFGQDLQF